MEVYCSAQRSPSSCFFFFSSRRRHTRFDCDWSSDVCSSDLRQRSLRLRTALPVDAVILELLATRDKSLQGMSQRVPHTLFLSAPYCKRSYSWWRCCLTAANACTMNSCSHERCPSAEVS